MQTACVCVCPQLQTVAYDGSSFAGFQFQPGKTRTVQVRNDMGAASGCTPGWQMPCNATALHKPCMLVLRAAAWRTTWSIYMPRGGGHAVHAGRAGGGRDASLHRPQPHGGGLAHGRRRACPQTGACARVREGGVTWPPAVAQRAHALCAVARPRAEASTPCVSAALSAARTMRPSVGLCRRSMPAPACCGWASGCGALSPQTSERRMHACPAAAGGAL